MTTQIIERIHCNGCGQKTRHNQLYKSEQIESEGDASECSFWFSIEFAMYQCAGCRDIVVRRQTCCSEWDPRDSVEVFYPPRIARRLPVWKDKLSGDLLEMLEQVYRALQSDSASLAMMGTRALVDMVIQNEVGDTGTFPEKLNALMNVGFLSQRQRQILETVLDVGNAAAHRGYRPNAENVQHVMEIVENLLHQTTLPPLAGKLKKSTPRRKKKAKTSSTKKSASV